jgi:hypothetical protein
MNHAPGAVTSLDPEMVQAGDVAGQRSMIIMSEKSVFISYSRSDRDWICAFASALPRPRRRRLVR